MALWWVGQMLEMAVSLSRPKRPIHRFKPIEKYNSMFLLFTSSSDSRVISSFALILSLLTL